MADKILILQRILPHYRVGIFKKFCRRFPGSKIIYGNTAMEDSLKNADVSDDPDFLKKRNFYFGKSGKVFFSSIYKIIFVNRPEIIISVFNTGNLNLYVLMMLRLFLGYKLILWSFGYDPARGFDPKKSFSDKLRLFLCRHADAVIFYWKNGLDEIKKFLPADNFFIAPNTLDTDNLFLLKEQFDRIGKDPIKKELGISEKFHFVFAGRLIPDKEVEILIRAYKIAEDKIGDCRLTIIGDGSERKKLELLAQALNIRNIGFIGEVLEDAAAGKWIYASDVFVMPGRLGLSVVHSFCFGVPVISQRKNGYFHGEGLGYIRNSINGFLTEDGNLNEIAEKIILITDAQIARRLNENAFKTALEECSTEKMLNGINEAIDFVRAN